MRPVWDDILRTRNRRSTLIFLTCLALGSLTLASLMPSLQPWLGAMKLGQLLLAVSATLAAIIGQWMARRSSAITWSVIDDIAWVISLCAMTILSATTIAPVSVHLIVFGLTLFALGSRAPNGSLVMLASTTIVLLPVARAMLAPVPGGVVADVLLASLLFPGFLSITSFSHKLLNTAIQERDAVPTVRSTRSTSASSSSLAVPKTWTVTRTNPDETRSENIGGSTTSDQTWESLVERVRSSITVMAENAGVTASVQAELSGLAPPSSKIRSNLVRIAQEVATQTIRHAEPRSIIVRLRRGQGGLLFELLDDGTATESIRQKRSLAALRGRAAALGGTAEIRRSDNGWITSVRLPCEQLN